jgi:hypothetical protein
LGSFDGEGCRAGAGGEVEGRFVGGAPAGVFVGHFEVGRGWEMGAREW